jgi:hypothetical protein
MPVSHLERFQVQGKKAMKLEGQEAGKLFNGCNPAD